MIDPDISVKINQAKAVFTDPDSKNVISEWETKLQELPEWQAFQSNEVTKQIRDSLKKRIIQIRTMLANSRTPEILENQDKWWAIIDECLFWLKAISKDVDKEYQDIKNEIETELSKI